MNKGTLFLIPTPLFFKCAHPFSMTHFLLPQDAQTLKSLRYFVVENAKTARRHLKGLTDCPLQELNLQELNEHTAPNTIESLLQPLENGHHLGLMSEAGCPAIADPGAQLVRLAHQKNIPVHPWVGASSLLLALMASGLNGQRFRFLGYLPAQKQARQTFIKTIEKHSQKQQETQIFIETPYRNTALWEDLLNTCAPQTQLTLALDLTQKKQWIKTQSVKAWQNATVTDLKNRLAVFLLLG